MTDLYQVLRQVVRILDALEISYAVMGGIAARAHGIPRPTYDLDFTIVVDDRKLHELFDRLEEQDLTVPEVYRSGWVDRVANMPLVKAKVRLGGRAIDIDLFLAACRFQDSLMGRRRQQEIDGIIVWMVTPEDLILLKLLAGRARDWADIVDVFFMQGELDVAYMRRWAKELGVEAPLEKALADAGRD